MPAVLSVVVGCDVVQAWLGQICSIGRSSLQGPRLAEQEGFMRHTRQRATMIGDVLIHFLGNAALGGPGAEGI
jgi:hypothetical protein